MAAKVLQDLVPIDLNKLGFMSGVDTKVRGLKVRIDSEQNTHARSAD
jgi:hypothetical protein